jgi:hypothetical protein
MRKILGFILMMMMVFSLTACSGQGVANSLSLSESEYQASESVERVAEDANPVVSAEETGTTPVAHADTHEDEGDYTWDASMVIPIFLNEDSISADYAGVNVEGTTATITQAGTYSLSGSLADGQIVVDTEDEEVVRLLFNGVDISNAASSAVVVSYAERVVIILVEGSRNQVSDAATYVYPNAETDEPNAAIFSASDLTITGNGSLMVNGNSNDGIASKDGLIIAGGNITVNAVDDGIRGKDYVVVEDGNITIQSGGDGLKSDNADDASRGFIDILAGTLNITSACGDAITAQTDVSIADGVFELQTTADQSAQTEETASTKGIKGGANVVISNGTFTINTSLDDAVHSNGSIVIDGGVFEISAGDDGIHADATLTINGGEINIKKSYEGLESAIITINAGEIEVIASDDGINVAGGNDGSGMMQAQGMKPGGGMGRGMRPDDAALFSGEPPADAGAAQGMTPPTDGQMPGGGTGQETFAANTNYYLYINGGTVVVNAVGDGLDANGAIEMTGGVVIVNGPTQQGNGALDYDAGFKITGGVLVTAGSAGMAMAPDSSSSQNSVLINFDSSMAAGTLVHIQNDAGDDILTFAPAKNFQSITFSSPDLTTGSMYVVFTGGSSSGTGINGLLQGGSYSAGAQYSSFTIAEVVTQV